MNTKIDYQYMIELKELLHNVIKGLLDDMEEAKEIVDKLDNKDLWRGPGYESFQDKMSSMATNYNTYCNDLYSLIGKIKDSVEKYKEADKEFMRKVGAK